MKKLTTILAIILASFQLSAQCNAFYDGFETGTLSPVWQFGTGTYTRTITTVNPAVGTSALEQTGSGSHMEGMYGTFTAATPSYISFRMKTNTTNAANGYVVVGDANCVTNQGILFCYFNSSGQLRFYNSVGQNFPIVANQWYHIELQNIDWTNKVMDVYMDGVLILPGWAFRSMSSVDVDRVHLYNVGNATATYDEIIVGGNPQFSSVISDICAGDSLVVNGTTYNASNPTGTEVLVGSNGCDSTVTIDLTPIPALTGDVTNTICSGDSVVVNGTVYNAANPTGTEILTGASGCDSTVTIDLTVMPALTGVESSTICSGDSVVVNGTTYNAANPTGTEIFSGSNGCDSTVSVNLTVNTVDTAITATGVTITANEANGTYQWIDCSDNSPIVGETGQSFTATSNGNYAVVVTINGCSDTSSCNVINSVYLDDLVQHNILVYPNPTDGIFTVEIDEVQEITSIEVTDILGKVIHTELSVSSMSTFDISDNQTGVYFVTVNFAKGKSVIKIIKE